jgi:hypothetical protein
MIETGRLITTGEYSGISAFTHNCNHFNIDFKSEEEIRQILELVRYANVHKQRPLVKEDFIFIAGYPKIAQKILTMNPPEISIGHRYHKRLEKGNYVKSKRS